MRSWKGDKIMDVKFDVVYDGSYDNWFITFPTGEKVQVRMSFPNRKFIYKIHCLFNESKKSKK